MRIDKKNIYLCDYEKKETAVEFPLLSEVASIVLLVISGDEVLRVTYMDGAERSFDSSSSREMNLLDSIKTIYVRSAINHFDEYYDKDYRKEKRLARNMVSPDLDTLGIGDMIRMREQGKYPIDRDELEGVFKDFLKRIDCDMYGYHHGALESTKNFITDNVSIETDTFLIRPFYWGGNDDILCRPNFVYKPEAIQISWYKYPLRSAKSNVELTKEKLEEILEDCVKSVKERG